MKVELDLPYGTRLSTELYVQDPANQVPSVTGFTGAGTIKRRNSSKRRTRRTSSKRSSASRAAAARKGWLKRQKAAK